MVHEGGIYKCLSFELFEMSASSDTASEEEPYSTFQFVDEDPCTQCINISKDLHFDIMDLIEDAFEHRQKVGKDMSGIFGYDDLKLDDLFKSKPTWSLDRLYIQAELKKLCQKIFDEMKDDNWVDLKLLENYVMFFSVMEKKPNTQDGEYVQDYDKIKKKKKNHYYTLLFPLTQHINQGGKTFSRDEDPVTGKCDFYQNYNELEGIFWEGKVWNKEDANESEKSKYALLPVLLCVTPEKIYDSWQLDRYGIRCHDGQLVHIDEDANIVEIKLGWSFETYKDVFLDYLKCDVTYQKSFELKFIQYAVVLLNKLMQEPSTSKKARTRLQGKHQKLQHMAEDHDFAPDFNATQDIQNIYYHNLKKWSECNEKLFNFWNSIFPDRTNIYHIEFCLGKGALTWVQQHNLSLYDPTCKNEYWGIRDQMQYTRDVTAFLRDNDTTKNADITHFETHYPTYARNMLKDLIKACSSSQSQLKKKFKDQLKQIPEDHLDQNLPLIDESLINFCQDDDCGYQKMVMEFLETNDMTNYTQITRFEEKVSKSAMCLLEGVMQQRPSWKKMIEEKLKDFKDYSEGKALGLSPSEYDEEYRNRFLFLCEFERDEEQLNFEKIDPQNAIVQLEALQKDDKLSHDVQEKIATKIAKLEQMIAEASMSSTFCTCLHLLHLRIQKLESPKFLL